MEKLAIGAETIYRGYSIVHEGSSEFRIEIYASTLTGAKQAIDWMIFKGCIKSEKEQREDTLQ